MTSQQQTQKMSMSSSYINGRTGRPGADGQIPNILTVKFDHLKDTQDVFPAEPTQCDKCSAVLTSISTLSEPDRATNRQTWVCEFCSHEKKLLIPRDEIPDADKDETYLLESPPKPMDIFDTMDKKHVVFCIDASGSMGEASPVPKSETNKLLGEYLRIEADHLNAIFANASLDDDQTIPQSSNNYVSRLMYVKMAIEESIHEIHKKFPAKVVALVTFNDKVNIIGDGLIDKLTIEKEMLNDKQAIHQLFNKTPQLKSIIQTRAQLIKELRSIREEGQTAMGPALLYSIQVASRKPQGQVILCTDGLANMGLGSLEAVNQDTVTFFEFLADFARQKGVTVSIFTIDGTYGNLRLLGELASKTNGEVKVVTLGKLKEEFAGAVNQQSIATNVEAKFILPKEMFVKDYENPGPLESVAVKKVGNVNFFTEISFQFEVREGATIRADKVPMQMQITYTDSEGGRYMRVITRLRPITNDLGLVKKDLDPKQIAQHLISSKAASVSQGKLPNELKNDEQNFAKLSIINEDESDFDRARYNREMENLEKTFKSRKNDPASPSARLFPSLPRGGTGAGLLDQVEEDITASMILRAKQINTNALKKKQND